MFGSGTCLPTQAPWTVYLLTETYERGKASPKLVWTFRFFGHIFVTKKFAGWNDVDPSLHIMSRTFSVTLPPHLLLCYATHEFGCVNLVQLYPLNNSLLVQSISFETCVNWNHSGGEKRVRNKYSKWLTLFKFASVILKFWASVDLLTNLLVLD